MRLDRYTRVADFLAAAGDFLAAREAEHNLILGISSSLANDPDGDEPEPYLVAVSDGDRLLGAAVRTPPHNLILSEVDDPDVPRLLVEDLAHGELPGVVGPPQAITTFADAWSARHGGSWRELRAERIYRLSRLDLPRAAAGDARLALPSDEPLVLDWLLAFGIARRSRMQTSGLIRRGTGRLASGDGGGTGCGSSTVGRCRWSAPGVRRPTASGSVPFTPRPRNGAAALPAT